MVGKSSRPTYNFCPFCGTDQIKMSARTAFCPPCKKRFSPYLDGKAPNIHQRNTSWERPKRDRDRDRKLNPLPVPDITYIGEKPKSLSFLIYMGWKPTQEQIRRLKIVKDRLQAEKEAGEAIREELRVRQRVTRK